MSIFNITNIKPDTEADLKVKSKSSKSFKTPKSQNRRKKLRLVAALLTVVLCFTAILPHLVTKGDAVDATTQSYQDRIAALHQQQEELKSKLNALKSDLSKAWEYKNNLDELARVTQDKIAAAESLNAELASKISETENDIAEKEEAIQTTFNKFLERMRVSYEEGEASYLSIIFGSEDMGDFLSNMDMVSSMLEYDRNLKIQYQNEKAALQEEKADLEAQKALQEETLKQLESDKQYYQTLSSNQDSYIQSLESDVSATNDAFNKAKAEDNKLNQELENYLKSLQSQNQAVYVGGEFIWPLQGYSYISSGFGWRTLFGVRDYHRGIDIPAPYGTPIHAANGGTVVTATAHSSYGNYVVIDHGGGKSTLYAHMSSIGCSVNQSVSQGDVIGYVGSTGYSTGNHLHVEVRINGEAQNPLNYLAR